MKLVDLVSFLCIVIALVILWQFRQILLLIFAAVVIAVALNSLVRWLVNRFQLARGQAVLSALGLVVLAGLLVLLLVVPLFISQFQQLLLLIPEGLQTLTRQLYQFLENPPVWFPDWQPDLIPNFTDLLQQVGSLSRNVFGGFVAFFSSSVAVLLQLLLITVLALMLLADPMAYRRLLIRLFPSFYRRRADEIIARCEIVLLNWMAGVSISSLFVATVSAIGLLLLDVPFVLTHALLAGLFNFIPNIGPTLSLVFPISVALIDSVGKAIAVVVLYLIIQNLESYWFSPMVMQKQVSLLPAATLVTQIFFATFFGPFGLILALPLAVVVKTWIEEAFIKDVLDQWSNGSKPPDADLMPVVESEAVLITQPEHPEDRVSTEPETDTQTDSI